MNNLAIRNYTFMLMIFLAVLFTYINKHAIVVIYSPFVIFTLIYMLIHRCKLVLNRSIAILLLIVLWSFIASSWAVRPLKGVSISVNLLLFILGFQALYWLSKYSPKIESQTQEHKKSPHKFKLVRLHTFLNKYGEKGCDYIAYIIILVSVLMILDSLLAGKISEILFHKKTNYKNQFWLEGVQTLKSGLLGSVAIILYKQRKFKLVFALIFISLASIITNYFYTGYAGIIMAVFAMIIMLILPRKLALWFFVITISLYYLFFPSFFGMLYDSSLMEKIKSYSTGSLLDRYVIWEYSHMLINKAWLFGHGSHSTRYITAIMSNKLIRPGVVKGVMTHFTHHPHNLALQIWIEYGLFGIIAYCLFLATLLKKIFSQNLPKYARLLLMMSFIIITAIQNTAWGMWETWFVLAISISLGMSNFVITYLEYEVFKDQK